MHSEICIAIFIRKIHPEYGAKNLSFLDAIQKFGNELIETPVTLILMTIAGFILLAFALRKQAREIFPASIAWGVFMGFYGSNLRFIAVTGAIARFFNFLLPPERGVSSINFVLFVLMVPLVALTTIILIFIRKASANNKVNIMP
ncbi:hypothetical protein ACO0LC_20135 [Undibacterium sp. JH2W]|uniref:hypothetical protein n=1 Tax=Undibacterium sp. JH2W TaxID=3413037 RepID=UPI003BF2C80C